MLPGIVTDIAFGDDGTSPCGAGNIDLLTAEPSLLNIAEVLFFVVICLSMAIFYQISGKKGAISQKFNPLVFQRFCCHMKPKISFAFVAAT
ncbi:hypothetical protein WKW50_24765 [Ochrobactrum sp. GPK 3]